MQAIVPKKNSVENQA